MDPNAKTGPVGYGSQGFIPGTGVLPYRIVGCGEAAVGQGGQADRRDRARNHAPYLPSRPACASASVMRCMAWNCPRPPPHEPERHGLHEVPSHSLPPHRKQPCQLDQCRMTLNAGKRKKVGNGGTLACQPRFLEGLKNFLTLPMTFSRRRRRRLFLVVGHGPVLVVLLREWQDQRRT